MMYPDLEAFGLPSLRQRAVRESIQLRRELWRPRYAPEADPITALAVIGAISMSSKIGRNVAWDGSVLRGDVSFAHELADAEWQFGSDRLATATFENSEPIIVGVEKAKFWAGQVTIEKIVTSCTAVVRSWVRAKARTFEHGRPLPWTDLDREADVKVSATGYDSAAIGISLRDGFSASRTGIKIVGARPILELLSLFGANEVERAGRWPTPHRVFIPRVTDMPLRNASDLDRLFLLAQNESLFRAKVSGKRSYLEVGART